MTVDHDFFALNISPLYPEDVSQAEAEAGVSPALPTLPVKRAEALTDDEKAWLKDLDTESQQRRDFLHDLVAIKSGSRYQPGIEAMQLRLKNELLQLEFSPEYYAAEALEDQDALFGPQQIFRRPARKNIGHAPRVLLLGHVDTVFEPDSGFDVLKIQGDKMYGPGCADMKGGLVVMISALQGLSRHGLLDALDLTILLNGDEEISSRSSRKLIEAEAKKADIGLVFEPGRTKPYGAVTLARKGTGAFILTVHGVAAHSGNRYIDGYSAVDVLAQKILALGRLGDLRRGITLNVGIVTTGTGGKRNKVSDWAQCEFDLRLRDPADADEILHKIHAIVAAELPKNPWTGKGPTLELHGGLARPPMPLDDERLQLYAKLAGLAEVLEQPFGAVSVGGGSDANIAAAQNLLIIDGMGPVGSGLHSFDEWVDLKSLDQRVALSALFLSRLAKVPLVTMS